MGHNTCEEFRKFAESYKFIHTTSSPRYPKGNGMAERAVQTVKKLLEKLDDPYLSMLDYISTPLEFGLSPAELLMNRIIASILPSIGSREITKIGEHIRYQEWQKEKIKKVKKKYNQNPKVKYLNKLAIGDDVYIRDLDRPAKVIQIHDNGRSYIVEGEGIIRRNRTALIYTNGSSYTTRSGMKRFSPKRYTE